MSRRHSSRWSRLIIGTAAGLSGSLMLCAAFVVGTRDVPTADDPTGVLAAVRSSILTDLFAEAMAPSTGNLALLDDLLKKPVTVPVTVETVVTALPDYTVPATRASKFTDAAGVTVPKAPEAVTRALRAVGNAQNVCDEDPTCHSLCDHIAGWVWGYNYSGYYSAATHWEYALKTGVAHPGSKEVPVGALLFWHTGPFGHVATYVGNGMAVSNYYGKHGTNIYLFQADIWEQMGAEYKGWAMPQFHGDGTGAAL